MLINKEQVGDVENVQYVKNQQVFIGYVPFTFYLSLCSRSDQGILLRELAETIFMELCPSMRNFQPSIYGPWRRRHPYVVLVVWAYLNHSFCCCTQIKLANKYEELFISVFQSVSFWYALLLHLRC